MASTDPSISKQGPAGKQKHPNLIIPQKLKILSGGLKVVKAKERLWPHRTFDHQLPVI
jgi:hypothetical protein